MSRRPDEAEHTRWSPALLGFYLSCAGVSLGAAIAFGSHKFFGDPVGTWGGALLSAVSSVTCFYTLRAARRPPSASQ